MNLSDLTWIEVKEYLKKRRDVLVPFGSVEEHGHHLPLSTDGDIALAIADKLGEKTGILAAPIIWYGISNTTRGYAGTTMVSFDSLRAYSKDVMLSLKESGFRIVYLLSGHMSRSHLEAIKEAAKAIDLETYLLDFSQIKTDDILETKPMHACEAETSLMLYLHPEKVNMRKAVDEKIEFEKFSVRGSLKKTKSGVFGSPTRATKEKGKKLFGRIVKELAEFINST
ncbi:MAG: creatininase family protein [Candidatus Hydrothermarchaeota archaeon]|nr:creatininase family protein [Candidatus Hydrothermarchaeota archaeon]